MSSWSIDAIDREANLSELVMAALLTRTSTTAYVLPMSSATSLTWAGSVRSATNARCRAPFRAGRVAATARARGASRSTTAMLAPARASRSARALPMPPAPPVMTTTLPAGSKPRPRVRSRTARANCPITTRSR